MPPAPERLSASELRAPLATCLTLSHTHTLSHTLTLSHSDSLSLLHATHSEAFEMLRKRLNSVPVAALLCLKLE